MLKVTKLSHVFRPELRWRMVQETMVMPYYQWKGKIVRKDGSTMWIPLTSIALRYAVKEYMTALKLGGCKPYAVEANLSTDRAVQVKIHAVHVS